MIDSFLYFNEHDLFFTRLEYLNPHVDKFVIVETDTTFSLQSHSRQFDQVYNKLSDDIKKKIVYHYLEIDKSQIPWSGNPHDPEFKNGSRYVEVKMRDTLADLICANGTNEWIAMSDLDEIWDPRALDQAKALVDQYGKMFWAQDFRTAFIDWQMRYGRWPGTRMTRVDILPVPTTDFYGSKNKTWGGYGDAKLEAGWHFTMMGDQGMKQQQIAAKREGPGWAEKLNKSYEQISSSMFENDYDSIVKKKKMRAIKVPEQQDIDPELYAIAKKYPGLWSGALKPNRR
jgi:hypothetical protein